MPVLFGIAGIMLIIAGVRDRIVNGDPSLMSLLKDDFSGNVPFWKWILAILFVGAIGYIPNLRPISRSFLVLIILVFILSNEGLFTKIEEVFKGQTNSIGSKPVDTLMNMIRGN